MSWPDRAVPMDPGWSVDGASSLSFHTGGARSIAPTANYGSVGAASLLEKYGAASGTLSLGLQDEVAEESGDEEHKDDTGTDPRDFRDKFMPYYRFTELKNGYKQHEAVLFGLKAFNSRLAMTYEIPVLKYADYDAVLPSAGGGLPLGPASLPGGPPLPGFGGGGPDFDPDGDEFGMGDSIFRLFYKPKGWEWEKEATWGPRKGEILKGSVFPLIETTVPTHTDDVLGEDSWIVSPGFVIAGDTPTFGFLAAMFFYDFSTLKDDDEIYTSRLRARIFMMQPFSKPGPKWSDGLYMMPEFQPIYDLRTSESSFWVGPEFGKVTQQGDKIITYYIKPGWGYDPDDTDRQYTFECGIRIFF